MTLTLTPNVCPLLSPTSGWAPKDKEEIKAGIMECLKSSPTDCSKSWHGPIGSWDVSAMTSMSWLFYSASSFNGDISKWDMSRVTNMLGMFYSASSFNIDISKWDVSKVGNMEEMFYGASSFTQMLCGTWQTSTADKKGMFDGSSGRICMSSVTTTTRISSSKQPTSVTCQISLTMTLDFSRQSHHSNFLILNFLPLTTTRNLDLVLPNS